MAKTTRILDRRGNVASPDISFTGEEPTWNDLDTLSVKDYYSRLARGLRFYNYYLDGSMMSGWVCEWMQGKYKKEQIDAFKNAPSWCFNTTMGALARMLNRGMPEMHPDAHAHFENKYADYDPEERPEPVSMARKLHDLIAEALKNAGAVMESKADTSNKAPIKSPFQRMQEKVQKEILTPLEITLDAIATMPSDTKPASIPNIDLGQLLKSNNIPANAIAPISSWVEKCYGEFNDAYNKTCEQAVEAYNWLSRPQLKRIVDNFSNMLIDVKNHAKLKVSTRKPRAKKPKAADKQVAKLKYAQNSQEYGLTSINATLIPFAQRLFVFNEKTRQLLVYYANNHDGFSVKGSTLCNFDADKSIVLRLRKPNDVLPHIVSGTAKKIDKLLSTLTTKASKANGRFNANMILLKVTDKK